jgi:hypothetical protein
MMEWQACPPNATKISMIIKHYLQSFSQVKSNANGMSLVYSTSFKQKDGERGYPYHLHDESPRITRGKILTAYIHQLTC